VEGIAWNLGLAGFAGFVAYIQRFAGGGDERPPWEWAVCGVKVVTGGFVGVLTLWLVELRLSGGLLHFAVAIAGYGGPVTLDFFLQLFRDALSRAAGKASDDAAKG
jgi:hypothetical protein